MRLCDFAAVAAAGSLMFGFNVFAASTPTNTTSAAAVTAQDQSTDPADAELTRKIRHEVMDLNVSTEAKNVTIVTNGGKVTISGQVPSAKERAAIIRLARGLASNVNDQIVVKK
jgi:osmotically-inducible protein OsmY